MLFNKAHRNKQDKDGLIAVDLFCGCGGLTLGLENVGFNVVCGIDNWQETLDVYASNFTHDVKNVDLSDVKRSVQVIRTYSPDILVGGPPCQDFSQAGKRKEKDRANLTIAFARIIQNVRPKVFLMENVDQLTKSISFSKAEKIFRESGYGLTITLLDASLCGVPQKRKRYFVIGILDAPHNALEKELERNLSENPMTVRDYFGDALQTEYYYRHPWSYKRRAVYCIDEPSPTVRGVNRPIPPGYPGHHLDATKDMSNVRPLTTIERSMVQTFPAGFVWHGSKTNIEQMIGNAVPVKLAEYVGKSLNEYVTNTSVVSVKALPRTKVISSIAHHK